MHFQGIDRTTGRAPGGPGTVSRSRAAPGAGETASPIETEELPMSSPPNLSRASPPSRLTRPLRPLRAEMSGSPSPRGRPARPQSRRPTALQAAPRPPTNPGMERQLIRSRTAHPPKRRRRLRQSRRQPRSRLSRKQAPRRRRARWVTPPHLFSRPRRLNPLHQLRSPLRLLKLHPLPGQLPLPKLPPRSRQPRTRGSPRAKTSPPCWRLRTWPSKPRLQKPVTR